MRNGHTPGPWEPYEHPNGSACIAVGQAGGDFYEAHTTCYLNSEANARLIAAAPELLDALECLKCELILSDVDMDYIESHFRPWLDKAAAAIAKARGTPC